MCGRIIDVGKPVVCQCARRDSPSQSPHNLKAFRGGVRLAAPASPGLSCLLFAPSFRSFLPAFFFNLFKKIFF
jgi:hypothetical protein